MIAGGGTQNFDVYIVHDEEKDEDRELTDEEMEALFDEAEEEERENNPDVEDDDSDEDEFFSY